jgi:uncharacterized protein YoxC
MTMESWGVALVVLAAVLVGAALPVLVQLRATLREVEKTLQRSEGRLDEALATTTAAAGRIDALVARLEEGGRIERLLDGVAAVTTLVTQLRDTVRVAAAVGAAVAPAVVAAVQAFREPASPVASEEAAPGSAPSPSEHGRQATP